MRVRVKWNSAPAAGDACTAYSYGETEDYLVNITACENVVLTTQPANKTAVCGGNTSFTVAASGSLPAFFWEYRTSASAAWQDVANAAPFSGVNTNTLTITAVSYTHLDVYKRQSQYLRVHHGA